MLYINLYTKRQCPACAIIRDYIKEFIDTAECEVTLKVVPNDRLEYDIDSYGLNLERFPVVFVGTNSIPVNNVRIDGVILKDDFMSIFDRQVKKAIKIDEIIAEINEKFGF